MIGVLVNVGAIITGGSVGLILKKGLPDRVTKVIMQGIGLSTLAIGFTGALQTNNMVLLVLSIIIGGAIGALIRIDFNLDKFGKFVESKFSNTENGFAKGFVITTLIYCVGAMAIVGSIEAGVEGDNTTLYVKSILDGVTAIVFAATLGYGVLFSSIPVLIYQGIIVLLGIQLQPLITEQLVIEIGAVGGIIIVGIGLTLLEIKKINLGDLLPSLLIPMIYFAITSLF